jgi:hypothetical protein
MAADLVGIVYLFFQTLYSRAHILDSISTDDYRLHTSCVTEVERYGMGDPNGGKKAKVTPQQAWMDLITSSVDSAPPNLRDFMQALTHLDNVPRKEKQFRNFASNSLNLRGNKNGDSIVGEIWGLLKRLRDEQVKAKAEVVAKVLAKKNIAKAKAEENKAPSESDSDDSSNDGHKPKKATGTTKTKASSDSDSDNSSKDGDKQKKVTATKTKAPVSVSESSETTTDVKSVKKAMKSVLKKSKDHSLTVKHLRKAVGLRLGVSQKDTLKKFVTQNLESSSKQKFVLKGKTVTLQID